MIAGLLLDRRCMDCDSFVSLQRRADGCWLVKVHHDSSCPWLRAYLRGQAR